MLFALGTMPSSFRAATLAAGASFHTALSRHTEETSRPTLIALGLLATGAAVALAHITGADVRGGLAGGQPHLLPDLLTRALTRPGSTEL